MESSDSRAIADGGGEVDVPRLPLSSLDNTADDDVFTSPSGTARDSSLPTTVRRETSFARKLKKHKSVGDINASLEDARAATKERLFKRADSLESAMGQPVTSCSILKRSSVTEMPFTDRPRRVSIARRVSVRGSYSDRTDDPDAYSRGLRKNVSFGRLPSDSSPDVLDTGKRLSLRHSPERRQSLRQTPERRQSLLPTPERRLSLFQSPEKPPRGPMRRRDSMMSVLRSELIKKEKVKFDHRGRYKKPNEIGMPRKERSSDEILSASKREPPPLHKRMSMPALTNRSDSTNSMNGDFDDEDACLSSFDRRKLTLLSSLDKMGVKLPPKRIPRKMSLDGEAEILKRAAKSERHGSLTSRTVLSNFIGRPLTKKKSQAKMAAEASMERELSDVTKAKLQKIFDTMTKQDAEEESETQTDDNTKEKLQKVVGFLQRKKNPDQVTSIPGLEGKKRHSLTEDDLATSTIGVFRSRLRRRRAHSTARAPHTFFTSTGAAHLGHGHLGQARAASLKGKATDRRTMLRELSGTTNGFLEDLVPSAIARDADCGHGNRVVSEQSLCSFPRLRSVQCRQKGSTDDEVRRSGKNVAVHVQRKDEVGGLLTTPSVNAEHSKGDPSQSVSGSNLLTVPCTEIGAESFACKNPVLQEHRQPPGSLPTLPEACRENTSLPASSSDLSTGTSHTAAMAKARRIHALTKLRAAVLSRTQGHSKPARWRREGREPGDREGDHGDSEVARNREKGSGVSVTAAAISRVVFWAKRQARKRRNRFRNLAKFICLLLRAWRIHAVAVNAILDQVHTIDVTVEGQAKDGLLFDITEYKADTEARLSQEAIRILKKRPVERTPEEVHYVQIALWNYKALAEYPVHMQKMIAERAWFESYGAKRVIVREGHVPMCFYFVLSGSALVSVMDLDKGVAKTVMYYNRGDSFGELAIMNNSRRQSTVISKENMQLLVLSDTDFIEVFMSGGLKDPEDPFLSSLSCLDGWPKEKLAENPKKALYSYFKRGTILVPDSLNNDWIIIVKSGSVSLLKKLKAVNAQKAIKQRAAKSFQEKLQELAEEEAEGETTHEERVQNVYEARQEILEKVGHLERFYALPEIFVDTNDEYNEMKRLHDEFTELHGTNLLHGRDLTTHTPMSDHQLSRAVTNASLSRQGTGTSLDHQKLGALVKKGPFMAKSRQNGTPSKENTALESRKNTSLSALFRHDTQSANMIDTKPTKTPAPPMFVNVQTLTKGMVFGLADIFFDNQPAMALVSNGAECISISKKLFMEHASHAFVTRIREDIYPYPSEEDLQENLEAQICWDFHRRDVMTHVVHDLVWKRADKNDARFNISPALGY